MRHACVAPRPVIAKPRSSPGPGCAAPALPRRAPRLSSPAPGPTPDGRPPWNRPCAVAARRHGRWPRTWAKVIEEIQVDHALDRAVHWLLERQDAAGWWCGELETNVTMTAEHVLLLRFLGLDIEPIREGATRHILNNQRDDGSWANSFGAPADLSTTIEAYAALKVL